MAARLRLALCATALLTACSPRTASLDGEVGQLIAKSARAHRVPAELMAAIAQVEGGLKLAPLRDVPEDELVPVAGVLELRHGRFDSLARGAELAGLSQRELIADRARGTEAGARVLADLASSRGIARDDLVAWAPIVEQLSGHLAERDRVAYRARVFAVLREGGELRARGGEILVLPPHEEIPLDLTVEPPSAGTQGQSDYPGAIWFPTPQTNKWMPGRDGYPVTMIAVHDTEGGWDASVATLQNDPGKSCHYIIDADGSRVGQFVSEADTAWHVGNGWYNRHMVGIEHVGYAGVDDYQTSLYEGSAALVRDIAARQALGPNGDGTALDRSVMVGHQEVPNGNLIAADSPPCPDSPGSCVQNDDYGGANNHRDPGVYWEWCQYMEIIGGGAHCKCNDAYTHFNCTHDMSERVKCADGVNVQISHCADNSCIIQPIGVDDTCGKEATSSSSSSSSTSSGGGAGGGAATGGAGGAGTGGAGGSTHGTGGKGTGAHGTGKGGDANEEGGCALVEGPRGGSAAQAAALLALAAIALRRRRS